VVAFSNIFQDAFAHVDFYIFEDLAFLKQLMDKFGLLNISELATLFFKANFVRRHKRNGKIEQREKRK